MAGRAEGATGTTDPCGLCPLLLCLGPLDLFGFRSAMVVTKTGKRFHDERRGEKDEKRRKKEKKKKKKRGKKEPK